MAKTIVVVNQKGGVGKTTTAVNLAAYVARHGKFALLVDMDPQANATSGLGIDGRTLEQGSMYDVLLNGVPLHDIIVPSRIDGLRVAPSSVDLAGANVDLVNLERREHKLHDALLGAKHSYDYVFLDCPPSLGLLTVNSLVAGDEALIPIQCEYYALEGLAQLLKTIELVQSDLKPSLGIGGVVLTMYDDRAQLSESVMHQLYQYFPNRIFRTVIPRNIRLAEAPSYGRTILEYDPKSKGGKAYERLAREFLEVHQASTP